MKKRQFEIIRKPEFVKTSFLFNNVEVTYVGTNPENGISFYCSLEHNYGVRVYPDGRKVLKNPSPTTCENNKIAYNAKRKQRYLDFKDAFGKHKDILVSHAVWMAAGRSIPEGYGIDHINGCTTDNNIGNLRKLDIKVNRRDGGFLTIIRNRGFNPKGMRKDELLRYFDRMAVIKPALGWRYRKFSKKDLNIVLHWPNYVVIKHFERTYNIQITFDHAN